jgi:protein gp37
MGDKTKIEYADATWNPVTGCTPISAGCEHCYAKRQAEQMQRQGIEKYRNGFSVTVHLDEMERPRRWKKPRRIFVCSMGDLFHERVPSQTIYDIVDVIRECPQHTFLVLTKRPKRMAEIFAVSIPENMWVGTTVEDRQAIPRLMSLGMVRAVVRFVSFEPLLEDLGGAYLVDAMDLARVDWVIVGGESGPGARPMDKSWVIPLRDHCELRRIPFFFKGWGGERPRSGGRLLDGRTYDELPEVQHGTQALCRAR